MKEDLTFPENLHYTAKHVWVKTEGEHLLAGITDYAQDRLEDAAYVDVPEIGAHVDAGSDFGTVESIKTVSTLFMPVSGNIIQANAALNEDPALVNRDCYGKGWIIKIKPDNPGDVDKLLNAESYRALPELA